MIAITIILIVATAILPLLLYSSKSTYRNQNLITASNLASSIMEEIRALDYESIGTVGGNPEGPVERFQSRILNGTEYKIETLISWGSVKGENPVAYKNIRVIVKGTDPFSETEKALAELHSIASRDGEEPLVEEGHLNVLIRDIENSPVEVPLLVSITGPETSSLFTDYSGHALFGMLDEGEYSVTVYIPDDMYAIGGDVSDSNSNVVAKNNIRVSNYSTTEIVFIVDKKKNAGGIELQFVDSGRNTPVVRAGKISIDLHINGLEYTIFREFKTNDFVNGVLPEEFFGIMPSGAEITQIKVDGIAGYKNYTMGSDRLPLTESGTEWDCIVPEKGIAKRVFIPLEGTFFYQESTKNDFNRYIFMSATLSANDDDTLSLSKFSRIIDLDGCESEASSTARRLVSIFPRRYEIYYSDNAFDGNTNTYWSPENNNNQWIKLELKESTVLKGFSLYSSNRGPKDFYIEVSDDGQNWKTVNTNLSRFSNSTGWKNVDFINPVSCKYFKLNITSTWSGNLEINEIMLNSYDGYAPSGYRIAGPLDISVYEIAPYFKVEWDANVPNNSSFEIRMLVLDEGVEPKQEDFTNDTIVSETDGKIPNISWGQSLAEKRLWIMENFTTSDSRVSPVLHYLRIRELYPND